MRISNKAGWSRITLILRERLDRTDQFGIQIE